MTRPHPRTTTPATRPRRPPRRFGAAALAGLIGLAGCGLAGCGLAGCGASTHHTAAAGTPAGTPAGGSATTTAPTLPKGVTNAVGVPTNVPNSVTLRKNVQLTSCAPTAGGWEASGVAANPVQNPTDYTITVFFTTATDTVIGTGATRVHLDGASNLPWTVAGTFTPAPATRCVLRGVG
jgi:hypothetical protein